MDITRYRSCWLRLLRGVAFAFLIAVLASGLMGLLYPSEGIAAGLNKTPGFPFYLGTGDYVWGHNRFGGGFFVSTVNDDGGTITSGGFGTPGLGNSTANFGFKLHDIFDASHLLGLSPNQRLLVGGVLTYTHEHTVYDGNVRLKTIDDYSFATSLTYGWGRSYSVALVGGDYGAGSLINNADSGSGTFSVGGLHGDLAVGHIFSLVDPKTAGYSLDLDVSGHGGYLANAASSFTDSGGTFFGRENVHSGDLGVQAKLAAAVHDGNWLLSPYIGATLDDMVGYQHTIDLSPTGTETQSEGELFWGGMAGLSLTNARGVDATLRGFYRQSSDVHFGGATVTLETHF